MITTHEDAFTDGGTSPPSANFRTPELQSQFIKLLDTRHARVASRVPLPCFLSPFPTRHVTCFPKRTHQVSHTLPATPWATPWIPNSQIADVVDVSDGFNWWGRIGGTQPNDEKYGTGGKSGQAHVHEGFPNETSIKTTNRVDVEPGRIDLGPAVRKVTRVYTGEHAFDYNTPTTVEVFEPEPNPCLLARIAKERLRLRYERSDKIAESEWNNSLLGLPQEPAYVKCINGSGTYEAPVGVDKNAFVEFWIENTASEEEIDHSTLRELRVYLANATTDEVLGDEVLTWMYQIAIDPDTHKQFTATQKKLMYRRLKIMKEQNEGKCPTGVCPDNSCALAPTFAERQEIHRSNTAKFDSIEHLGKWYCWVQLNGQWYPKFLSLPLGETSPKKVHAAFRKLIREEVNKAGKSRSARAERRAAFDTIQGLYFLEVVWDEDAGKTYVWDRLAGDIKVVDDATGNVQVFDSLENNVSAAD